MSSLKTTDLTKGLSAATRRRLEQADAALGIQQAENLEAIKQVRQELRKVSRQSTVSSSVLATALKDRLEKLTKSKRKPDSVLVEMLEQETQKQTAELEELSEEIASSISKFVTAPISKEVSAGLELLTKQARSAEKKIDAVSDLSRSSTSPVRAAAISLECSLTALSVFRRLHSAVMSVTTTTKRTPLPVNKSYPQDTARIKLANACARSARSEIQGAFDHPGEMMMLAMFISDANNHYKLGAALLNGAPKAIERASSMDTASRENLPDSVWSFVNKMWDTDRSYGNTAPKPPKSNPPTRR